MTRQVQMQSTRSIVHRRTVPLAVVVAIGCVAMMVTLLAAIPAVAAEPPSFLHGDTVEEIHATRAKVLLVHAIPSPGENTSISETRIEYSKNATGPYIVAGRSTEHELSAELTHLEPETVYYARLFAETHSGGSAAETLKFTTTAPGTPEVSELKAKIYQREDSGEIGTSSANFEAKIETNAIETNYKFEYSTSEAGPYSPFTTGEVGAVSAAEESANPGASVTGLAPETTYYVRVTAENADGDGSETTSFTTKSAYPEVESPFVIDDTGTSIFAEGYFYTRSAESHWRFEYATSAAGPWEVGPEGTITAAEANEHVSSAGPSEITALKPATKYYVRLYVDNGHGSPVIGNITSFETVGPPDASTFPTHAIEGDSIRVLGSVTPNTQPIKELQTLTMGGNPSGGTYTLSLEAHTTAPLPLNAEFIEIDEALWALPGLNPTDVGVLPGNGLTKTIEFYGSLESVYVPQITVDASGLIPSGTITMATPQKGFAYETHYHIEYVTKGEFETSGWAGAVSTPEVDAGEAGVVGEDLPSLKPGETYHFRFSANNTTPGDPIVKANEETLTIPASSASEEAQAACPNETLRTGPSAHLPDCRAYEQVTPVEKAGAEDVFHYGAIYEGTLVSADGEHLFLRAPGVSWGSSPDPVQSNYFFSRTPAGWQMTSTKPLNEVGPDSLRPEIFNPDLTQIGLSSAWGDSSAATSVEIEFKVGPPGGPYQLVASIPLTEVEGGAPLVAASADGSKYILQTADHTLAGHRTGTTSGNDLYEFSEGHLRQVNVLGGSPGAQISACGAKIPAGAEREEESSYGAEHAVSVDGSRVFFTDDCTHHLYMRVDGAETFDLGEYVFVAANAEGSKLLLEKHSGENHELFLYGTEAQTAKYLFTTNEPAGDNAFKTFLTSNDFSTVYFTSGKGRLTPEAPLASTIDPDVYRYDITTKTLYFVMQGSAPRYVSPDGHFFYFGYAPWHSEQTVEGLLTPNDQVYSYDSGENVIECVSCASSFDPSPRFPAVLPTDGTAFGNNGAPVSTVASANGDYVFFDTISAALPQDVDGERAPEVCITDCHPPSELESNEYSPSSDVYEWRKNGVGGCTHIQGCLALITTGKGGFLNEVLGTDSSGRDVFFATHESLAASDDDTAGDIYDARIDGGFPPPAAKPVECEGDSCSTPFAAPNDLTPSSSTFQGAGDLTNGAAVEIKSKQKKPKKSTKSRKKTKKKKASAKTRKRTVKKAKKSNHRRDK